MNKFVQKFTLMVILILSGNVLANNTHQYNSYEDEGDLLFKIRGFYHIIDGDLSRLPTPNLNTISPKEFASNGYGFDASFTYFFNHHIATELFAGLGVSKIKKTALSKAAEAYGDGTSKFNNNKNMYFIPFGGTVQYHIAPFGAIRPYVGAGYHASFISSRSKLFKISSGHGAILQMGVDFVSKDDMVFTIDIRQFFLKTKMKFKGDILSTAPNSNLSRSGNLKLNPLIISAGIGFKF